MGEAARHRVLQDYDVTALERSIAATFQELAKIDRRGSRQDPAGSGGPRRICLIIYFIVILSMPFLRHQFWDAEFAPGLTVTKMFGAVCLLYALIHLARRHGIPIYFATLQAKLMILFFAMAAFSYASMGGKLLSADLVNPIYMYASTLVFFFITMTVIDSMKRMYWSFMVAIGSVAFASLYMLREWQKGTEAFGEGYRPGWVVGDSNYFTIAALAVLPIAFELVLVGRTRTA